MATDDQGSGAGSVQDPGANNKSGEDSSLSARRARLRPSLTKPTPTAEYGLDPYATQTGEHAAVTQTGEHLAVTQTGEQYPVLPSAGNGTGSANPDLQPWDDPQTTAAAASVTPDPAEAAGYQYGTQPASPPNVVAAAFFDESVTDPNKAHQISPAGSMYQAYAQSRGSLPPPPPPLGSLPPAAAPQTEPSKPGRRKTTTTGDAWPSVPVSDEEFEQSHTVLGTSPAVPQPTVATPQPAAAPLPQPTPQPAQPATPKTPAIPAQAALLQAAGLPPAAQTPTVQPALTSPAAWRLGDEQPPQTTAEQIGAAAETEPAPEPVKEKKSRAAQAPPPAAPEPAAIISPLLAPDPKLQSQTVEVLNNIDQAMGACAMNLSALQKIATEQTDTLKSLAETMQNQNFFEIGLNLNAVIESVSAALEPMKAVGELVPAIDQLVTALDTRENTRASKIEHLAPEELAINLADQLSQGTINAWTFKCAYMAVFPEEQQADLLRRLVDLLGTQRITGETFRAAYDAVQANEGPQLAGEPIIKEVIKEIEVLKEVVKVVPDEKLLSELEELKKLNAELQFKSKNAQPHDDVKMEELHRIVEQLQEKLEQRENEFSDVIAAKDRELLEAQELLTSRWEEFNARYDELTDTLHKRDDLLAEKDTEVSRKEIEVQQLKAQMTELQDSFKDTVQEMQKQLSAANKPQQGNFFDSAPPQGQPANLFDPAPSRQLFQPGAQGAPAAVSQPQPEPVQHETQNMQPPPQPAVVPVPAPQPVASSNQAIPRPPSTTTTFNIGGSYGSGVRAQVFEVIVRQALAGAPWREICAGPMQVNNITPEEVEAEVKRRQALLGKK